MFFFRLILDPLLLWFEEMTKGRREVEKREICMYVRKQAWMDEV